MVWVALIPRECRHCKRRGALRCRGLCNKCWHTPSILVLYPPEQDSRRGVYTKIREPESPTDAPPATEAKIRVLEERAARGENLFHPKDLIYNNVGELVPADELGPEIISSRRDGITRGRLILE